MKEIAVPDTFVPRFWTGLDGRCGVAKEIRRRYEELRQDTGADSHQRDTLCQRAVFMGVQLETMECEAAESGKFDPGVYTQMCNSLLGLLRALGLDRHVPAAGGLQAYLREQEAAT